MFKFDKSMIGRKVRFINSQLHGQFPGWFPPVGTIGVLSRSEDWSDFDGRLFLVEWPENTTLWPYVWVCNVESLELVEENS